MIRHYGFYLKRMIRHYVIYPTIYVYNELYIMKYHILQAYFLTFTY